MVSKRYGIFLLVSIAVILGVLLFFPRDAAPTGNAEELPMTSGYVLGISDGFVAVFDAAHSDTPLRTTDIPISSLRHYDRELLTRGIPLATEEEVLMRLEDFGS